jgi:hypothetical protein
LSARDEAGAMKPSVIFHDPKKPDGSIYFVTAEEWSTLESNTTSNRVRVRPTGIENLASAKDFDKSAPPAVTDFSATAEADAPGQYRLKWTASPAADVRYYNVYFSAKGKPEVSQKRLIASPLASMKEYLDWSAPIEGGASYAITAVDRQGNESMPAFAEAK